MMFCKVNAIRALLAVALSLWIVNSAFAIPLLISITNPPNAVTATAAGDTQFWSQAGTLGPGGTPISLRATVQSISAGDAITFFTSGDDPVVRANTGSLSAAVLWEVFDRATGLPIVGDPDFLITDIDGRRGIPIESVSAACAGLTSYTTNGSFAAGDTNIRVSESGGSILAEGTQGQNAGQPEGYMQYSWTGVSSWTVSYFATSGGRWYVHDADSDTPFDGTRVDVNLVDLATIKGLTPGSLTSPAQGGLITFQIDLSNAGPSPATNANLIDALPAGVMYDSHTVTSGNYDPGSGVWDGVDVAVNGVETLTITALVTAPAFTTVTNVTTTALADESVCSSRDLLEYEFVVAETPAPALTIAKSIDPVTNFSQAGDTITYSYLVTNTGNVNIDGVVPIDMGPTFGSQTATNLLSGFSPASAAIIPGSSQTFTATYLLDQIDIDNMVQDASPTTAIDNTATATGMPTAGMLPAVIPSTAETGFAPAPSLNILKSVSTVTAFAQAGDTITYQYEITNTGNITIDAVSPTDTGPTFNGTPGVNSLTGFMPLPVSLAPMASQTFTATYVLDQVDVDNMAAAPDPLTAIDNSASATGDPVGATPLPIVPVSLVETGFEASPGLSISKSVSPATTFSMAGDTITYQYEVENTGNVTLNNVLPTDSGPTFNGAVATNSLSAFSPASATIAPTETQNFTATYLLDQVDIDNMYAAPDPTTAIDNTASAVGMPTGGTLPAVIPSTAETGFVAVAALTLDKSAGVPSIGLGANATATDAGDTIAYSFAVTNGGTVSVTGLQINDLGVTFNATAGTGSLSAIDCPVTDLAPGQMTTCTALYTLSALDVDNAVIGGANAISNTANASGLDPASAPVNSGNETEMTTIAADSSVDITKSASAPTVTAGADATIVDPGDTINYTVAVENTGNTTLSGVMVNDSLTTLVCPATTVLGNAFNNNGSDVLVAGDSISCTATYSLLQSDLDAGGVMNTASVTSMDPTGAVISDMQTVNSGFTQRTSVSLVKSGTELPPNPMAGDLIFYSFRLTNTGNVTLTGPQVNDARCEAPVSPLTFTNGFVMGDVGGDGEMEAGESWLFQCEYAITQIDINLSEVANTATGTGTPPPGSGLAAPTNTASNLAEAQQNTAISLIKTAALPTVTGGSLATATDAGDTVSYTFEVENTGNVTLTNVVVSDPLITGAPNNGTISCPAGISSMAPADVVTCTATYTLTLTDINAGQTANTAGATGTPPVTVPPTDTPVAESSSVVTLNPAPELSVTKSVDPLPLPFAANSVITYHYEIENTGNVTITGVVPVDIGPSFNGVTGTNVLSAFTPASADLDPGTSATYTATYIVSQIDIDNLAAAADSLTAIDNSATANGVAAQGNLPPVTPSVVETGLTLVPATELIKTSTAPAPALVGSLITYSFSLENTGVLSISNPIVTDGQCVTPGTILSFTSGYVSGDNGATAEVLDPGEIWMFSCTYPISQADIDAGTVQNSAVSSGQDPAGETVEDTSDTGNTGDGSAADDDPTNTPLVRTPGWTVAKSTASEPTMVNDTLVYQFVVDNTGNVSISNIAVSDAKCAAVPVLSSGDLNTDMILDPTEIWTYQCTSLPITQIEVDAATVNNAVSVSGSPPAGSPDLLPATDSVATPIVAAPNLSVSKSAEPPTAGLGALAAATDAGDTISYSFEVENTGNVTLTAIAVSDVGPSFGVPATSGAGAWSGVSCPVSTLLPAQSTTCTAIYTLAQSDIDLAIAAGANTVTNSATADGTSPAGPVVTSPASTTVQTISSAPGLEIVKTAGDPTTAVGNDPDLIDPDDTVPFTIAVENTGNATLNNVLVSDDLTSVACDATAAPSGNAFINGTGSLAVGDTISCSATYIINQDDINAGQIINTGSVESVDPSGLTVAGVAEATTNFAQRTSVALQKTSSTLPPMPVAGVSTLTYDFLLENTGNVSLTSAQVSDVNCQMPTSPLTLASGFVSGDDGNGELDAGEIWLFQCDYVVTQGDLNAGEISNVATGTGTPPVNSGLDAPSATSSNLSEAQQFTGITLDKVAGIPTQTNGINSQVGDTVTFTFNISNTGNVSLTDIVLDDPLITGAPNNGTISCVRDDVAMTPFDPAADTLNPMDAIICSGDYALQQIDIDGGSVGNVANIEASPPTTVPPTENPTAISGSMMPIPADSRLSIDKTASAIPVTVVAGDLITYSYEVRNTGNVSVSIISPVDLGPTFNGVSGTNVLSSFTPTPVELAPGEPQTFTATYEISQVDLDNMAASPTPATAISNEATAEGEPANGPPPVVVPDTVDTGVGPDPEMVLTKTSTVPISVSAGTLITYNFALANMGNVTISNPVINDARCEIPASPLSFSSGYLSGDVGVIPQSLDVGEIWAFSCAYAVTQADIDAGTVQNTATAVGQDPAGGVVEDVSDSGNAGDDTGADNDPTNSPLARTPSFAVAKSTQSTPSNLGDNLVYEFLVTNTGNVSISGVIVTDIQCQALPALVPASDLNSDGFLSPAGAGGSPAAEQWLYTCTSLPLEQADMDAGEIDNNVSIQGTAPGGNPANAFDAITTPIATTPAISLVKSAGASTLNPDGSVDQVFNFALKNTGNVTLNTASITDNIPAQFGTCFQSVISAGTLGLTDVLPAGDSTAPASGTAPAIATVATLAVGDSIVVDNYIVRFNPNNAGCTFPTPAENTATANAVSNTAGPISDVSDNGTDPDAGNSNDPGNPTPFLLPTYVPTLGSSKAAGIPTLNADGSIDVEYTIRVQNVGNVDIRNLTLFDDLASQFGAAYSASPSTNSTSGILSSPTVNPIMDANTGDLVVPMTSLSYDGTAASNMFDGASGYLGIGDIIEVRFTARIDPTASGAPSDLLNTATVGGIDPAGMTTTDDTDSGSDPTLNPGGPGTPTLVVPPASSPGMELVKTSTLNSNGSIDYSFSIMNTGNVNILDIMLTDPLLTNFVFSVAIDADSDNDIDLLAPGATAIVTANYVLTDANLLAGSVVNTAEASGIDSTGVPVRDDSDSGNPADNTGADDDPTVTVFDPPSLGVAKDLKAGTPVDLGNGTYQVSYEFVIENTGPFNLTGVQLDDDLDAMINNPNVNTGTFTSPVVTSPNNTLTPSASFNGSSDTSLLSGGDTLLAGETGLVELTFVFLPGAYFGPFFNQAVLTANDSNGNQLEDLSEQGSSVNPDSDSLTPFSLSTPSTPITLGWFRAELQGGVVLIDWATEVEVSNAGFYLSYEDASGKWHRLNQEMIAAKGDSTDVQTYQFTVPDVEAVSYKLTDVSVTGIEVDHGPFAVDREYGVQSLRKQTTWDDYQSESDLKRQRRQQKLRDQMQNRLRQMKNHTGKTQDTKSGSLGFLPQLVGVLLNMMVPAAHAMDLVSFNVTEAGLYRVTHAQLLQQGVDLSGIAVDRLGLEQGNQPSPLKVYPNGAAIFAAGSSIVFPGQGLVTLYSGENKYTLVLDGSTPSVIQDDDSAIPLNTAPAPSYLAEKTYAPQNRYTHISPSENDSWYADRLQAINAAASKNVSIVIDDHAPALNTSSFGAGSIARMPVPRPRLEVNLWGGSNLPGNGVTNPDHHVVVDFNGSRIADESFDGLHEYPIEKVLTNLNQGSNSIDVTLPRDHGYRFDLVNLDRISIRYPRLFKAEDSGRSLTFESTWNFFKVRDLAANAATVVRVDESRQGYFMTTRGSGYCTAGCIYFSGSSSDENAVYYVATNNGFKSPEIELVDIFDDIFDGEASYLIIAHPDFINTSNLSLEAYASELESSYGTADIVSVDSIYGQYSGHVFDANAIYSYIKDAYTVRNTRHVLLVGGDMYDYHNNLQNGARSFVPSLYVKIDANVNAVPSDSKYADIDDDQIPDITISRLPVRSSGELDIIMSKRQNYLARSFNGKAIFAADKVDYSGYSFKSDSNQAIASHFSNWDVNTVYVDDVGIEAGKQSLVSQLNSGASLTSYFGHSSTDRWSISGLLTGEDVADLTNYNSPTVVSQWGCWNTFYVSPEQDSLAHRFLVDGQYGAVTVMGASSFTKADAEKRMANLLFERLSQGMRIGDAVLSAKRALAENYPQQLDVLLGWAVLGPDDFPVIAD